MRLKKDREMKRLLEDKKQWGMIYILPTSMSR